MKEHPLHSWARRELIRPARKVAQKVTGSGTARYRMEVRTEIQDREKQLRELREQVRELEGELERAPRETRRKERLRQISRQKILEEQKMLNLSLTVPDARSEFPTRKPVPLRRSRHQAKKEAQILFFLLLPVCVALCYYTVKLLLQ